MAHKHQISSSNSKTKRKAKRSWRRKNKHVLNQASTYSPSKPKKKKTITRLSSKSPSEKWGEPLGSYFQKLK